MPTQLDVETRAQQAQQSIVELARRVLSPTRMVVGQIKSVADVSSGFVQVRIEDANTNVGIGYHTSDELTAGDFWLVAQDTYTNRHLLIYKLTDSAGNAAPPTSLSLNKPSVITLNADETGTPSQDAIIQVERGTSDNAILKWEEAATRWSFLIGTYRDFGINDDEGAIEAYGLYCNLISFYGDPFDSSSTLWAELAGSAVEFQLKSWSGDLRLAPYSNKTLILQMGDKAGATKVSFRDNVDVEVASINSNGNLSAWKTYIENLYFYDDPINQTTTRGQLLSSGGGLALEGAGVLFLESTTGQVLVSLGDNIGGQFFSVRNASGSPKLRIWSDGKIGSTEPSSNTNTPSGATAYQLAIYDINKNLLGYIPIYGAAW